MLPDCAEVIAPFIPSEYRIKLVADRWELAEYHRLRRAIFCSEQAIFDGEDSDDFDRDAIPIVALASLMGIGEQVVGTVRIHQQSPGLWYGSRLGVARDSRRLAFLSWGLIRLAVGTAQARGCSRFLAHVQTQNVELFERLHWNSLQTESLHGRPHHLMRADLAFYPPCLESELRPMPLLRQAA